MTNDSVKPLTFDLDFLDQIPKRDIGVIQDPITWQYIRWCRDAPSGTLRLSVEDCYRFLRVRRSEKPNSSKFSACVGYSESGGRTIPRDDDLDGSTVVQPTLPFSFIYRILLPLPDAIRRRAAVRINELVSFVAEWEEREGLQSQRPCLKETSHGEGISVSDIWG